MIRGDARGRRIAIVPDFMVNPESVLYEGVVGRPGHAFEALIEDGWGIMKPPPHVLPDASAMHALATIAGDAVDYQRHGYTVTIVALDPLPQGGVWLDLLLAAFRELRAATPPVVRFALTRDDLPRDEFRAALVAASGNQAAAAHRAG